MDAPHNCFVDQLWTIFFLWNIKSIYMLLFFNPEQITESLFLENRCQDSRCRSFWSQRDITGRAMAKHCSFKCIHVLAVYAIFCRYLINIMLKWKEFPAPTITHWHLSLYCYIWCAPVKWKLWGLLCSRIKLCTCITCRGIAVLLPVWWCQYYVLYGSASSWSFTFYFV